MEMAVFQKNLIYKDRWQVRSSPHTVVCKLLSYNNSYKTKRGVANTTVVELAWNHKKCSAQKKAGNKKKRQIENKMVDLHTAISIMALNANDTNNSN